MMPSFPPSRRNASSRKILYLQYTNPAAYPSLEHSSRLLANAGWQVMFLGTGAWGARVLTFPPHERISVQQMPFQAGGWKQKLHYFRYMLWSLRWGERARPQWVYASDPLSAPTALLLSYVPGIKIVYHEHDSPALGSPMLGSREESAARVSAVMRLVLAARRRLAQRAEVCVLPNARRIEEFIRQTHCPRPPLCVWNCPRVDEIAPARPSNPDDAMMVYYHGSVNAPRLPAAVILALARLPEAVRLRIVGYETIGSQGYVRQLQARAHELALSHRVEFCLPLSRRQLLHTAREGDVGLALVADQRDGNLQALVGASNKPFDYLASGQALLVSDVPDWHEMYVEPGYGLACDPHDPASIANTLHWFVEHPAERRAMGERGRQRILDEWNYEKQFKPVFDVLNGSNA